MVLLQCLRGIIVRDAILPCSAVLVAATWVKVPTVLVSARLTAQRILDDTARER